MRQSALRCRCLLQPSARRAASFAAALCFTCSMRESGVLPTHSPLSVLEIIVARAFDSVMPFRSIGFNRMAEVDFLRSNKYSRFRWLSFTAQVLDSILVRQRLSKRCLTGLVDLAGSLRYARVQPCMPACIKRIGTNVFSRFGRRVRSAAFSLRASASRAARLRASIASITSAGTWPQMHLTGHGRYWIRAQDAHALSVDRSAGLLSRRSSEPPSAACPGDISLERSVGFMSIGWEMRRAAAIAGGRDFDSADLGRGRM